MATSPDLQIIASDGEAYAVSLLSRIGRGSFGCVYRGKDRRGRAVAVKELDVGDEGSSEMLDMAVQEIQALTQLKNHERFVHILGVSFIPGSVWIVMEHCDLGDLQSYCEANAASLTPQFKLQLMLESAEALQFLHSMSPPLAHRDVKPGNILLKSSRQSTPATSGQSAPDESAPRSASRQTVSVKLADFGLAKLLGEGAVLRTFLGSPAYMAPEFFASFQKANIEYDVSVDVFALGLVYIVLMCYDNPASHKFEPAFFIEEARRHGNSVGQYLFHTRQPKRSKKHQKVPRQEIGKDEGPGILLEKFDTDGWGEISSLVHEMIQSRPSARPSMDQVKAVVERESSRLQASLHACEQLLSNWQHVTVNIAVTGISGSGKSTFINTIRGIRYDDEPGYAPVGVLSEGTMEPAPYSFPRNPNIKLWDLPGIDTPNFPRETYFEQTNFREFDMYILLNDRRFREADVYLIENIERMGKKFAVVCSHFDIIVTTERNSKRRPRSEGELMAELKRSVAENVAASIGPDMVAPKDSTVAAVSPTMELQRNSSLAAPSNSTVTASDTSSKVAPINSALAAPINSAVATSSNSAVTESANASFAADRIFVVNCNDPETFDFPLLKAFIGKNLEDRQKEAYVYSTVVECELDIDLKYWAICAQPLPVKLMSALPLSKHGKAFEKAFFLDEDSEVMWAEKFNLPIGKVRAIRRRITKQGNVCAANLGRFPNLSFAVAATGAGASILLRGIAPKLAPIPALVGGAAVAYCNMEQELKRGLEETRGMAVRYIRELRKEFLHRPKNY